MIEVLKTAIVAGSTIWCVMQVLKMIEGHFISKAHLDTFTEQAHALQEQIKASEKASTEASEEKVNQLASKMDALLMHNKMTE